MTSSKPAVLVDVDGVLNALLPCNKPRPTCKCHPGWTRVWAKPRGTARRYKLTLNPAHGVWLRALAADTGSELVWSSYWEGEANKWVSPTVGLPTNLGFVPIERPLDPAATMGGWKAHKVAMWAMTTAHGRPFVWFEDEPDAAAELADLYDGPAPYLVVSVDQNAGLTEANVKAASTWLREYAGVTA